MESSMEVSQNIKNGSAFWSSDPTSGNILEDNQNTNLKEQKHLYSCCGVIYNHQDMEASLEILILNFLFSVLYIHFRTIYNFKYHDCKINLLSGKCFS